MPDAPKTYAEFAALVSGRPAGDLPLIVARIRGANAAALAADNRRGLQVCSTDCRRSEQSWQLPAMLGRWSGKQCGHMKHRVASAARGCRQLVA